MKKTRILKFRNAYSDNFRAISMLENCEIYFSSFDQLNDPFEAKAYIDESGITNELKIEYLNAIRKHNKDIAPPQNEVTSEYLTAAATNSLDKFGRWIVDYARADLQENLSYQRNQDYVFSLSMTTEKRKHDKFPSPLPNMLMWAHYAGDFSGFCLEFEFHELKNSLRDLNNCQIYSAPIDYEQENLPRVSLKSCMEDTIHGTNKYGEMASKIIYTKHICWKEEKEVRLHTTSQGIKKYSPNALKAIYVSYKCDRKARRRIQDFIHDKPWIKLYVVHLNQEKYRLGFFTTEEAISYLNFDFYNNA